MRLPVSYSMPLLKRKKTTNIHLPCHVLASFNAPDRPGVVRSFIKATVPLSLTDVHEDLTSASKIVAKVMIRQALIEGIQNGYFVP